MKRLLTILFVLCSLTTLAQYPATQTLGSDSTVVKSKGPLQGRMILFRYSDTSQANKERISQYPNSLIVVGNTMYLRDSTASKWIAGGASYASEVSIINDSSITVCNSGVCDTFTVQHTITSFTVVNDSTIQVCGDTCTLIHISPTPIAKSYVDSTKLIGGVLYYYIDGNAYPSGNVSGMSDGLISGGIVTWSGQGLKFYVSPATYVISNIYYHSGLDSVTLAAPTSNSRIDLIGADTTGHAFVDTGVVSATPIVPQAQVGVQIPLTTGILINAGDTIPTQTITKTVFDENLQQPDEWDTLRYGSPFIANFESTDNPKHGSKAIYISSYHNGAVIRFQSSTYETLTSDQIISFWVYLKKFFSNNMYILLYNSNTQAMTNWLPITADNGLSRSDSSKYQQITFNTSNFTWTGDNQGQFNNVEFYFYGSDTVGTKGLYMDWITLQKGIQSVPPPTDYSNKLDSVFLSNDSLFQYVKGVKTFRGLVTGGTGNTKYILQGYGVTVDSSGSRYTISVNTTLLKDSVLAGKGITVGTLSGHTFLKVDSQYVRDTSLNLAGGTINQVLKKNSSANGDWSWQDESGGGGTTLNGTGYVKMSGTTPSYITSPDDSAAYYAAALFSDTSLILMRRNGINDTVSFHVGVPQNKVDSVKLVKLDSYNYVVKYWVNGTSYQKGDTLTKTATGLVSPGSNVTITGTGTNTDPYVINSTASGGGGTSDVKQQYTGSTAVTVTDTTTWLVINPASLAAAITITMPANPTDKQKVEISFGGTVTSGTVVTALTISPNTGQAILQATTPSSVSAGEAISYRYNSTNSKWYRIN